MTNDKSLNQFYQNFMEEVLVASDMETSGWMIDDFLTSIILEYLEEAGEVTDPIMCPFRSYGLQLNAYSISEDYSSLDLFVCVYSNNKIPRSVSQTDIDVAIKRAIQLYQKATNDLYASFEKDNDTYEFAITVNKYKAKIKAVRICALTNGLVKPIPFKSISIGDAEISFTIWDIDRLYRCVTSGKMRETIEIDFQDKYGITIVIEPLNREECNIINTFREGCIFAEQVGDPRIRVLADYYHFSLEQDSIEDLKKYGKQYLRHVHFAETKGRFYPKDKKPEYREFICALQEAGYKGRISCEGYSDDLLTDGKNGIRILTEIWDAATEETK